MVTIRHGTPLEGSALKFAERLRNISTSEVAALSVPEQLSCPHIRYNEDAGGQGEALQEGHTQLRLLGKQIKKRTMMRKQEDEAVVQCGPSNARSGVSPPASARLGSRDNLHDPSSAQQIAQHAISQQRTRKQIQQQAHQLELSRQWEAVPERAGQLAEGHIGQKDAEYQKKRLLLEEEGRRRLEMVGEERDAAQMAHQLGQDDQHGPNLQDYQMQLMLLEQQNKKRLWIARQEQDTAGPSQHGPDIQQQDYQLQLMLLEQQNKKRLLMSREEQDPKMTIHEQDAPTTACQHANNQQQDYQMQLMLLEQQNKKRLLLSRQKHEAISPTHPIPNHDYEHEMSLLEQQNRMRLAMARQTQDAVKGEIAWKSEVKQDADANLRDYENDKWRKGLQNKRRLAMARVEGGGDGGCGAGSVPLLPSPKNKGDVSGSRSEIGPSDRNLEMATILNQENQEPGFHCTFRLKPTPSSVSTQVEPHKVAVDKTDPVQDFELQLDAAFGLH